MAVFETVLTSDLKKPVQVKQLTGNLFSSDNGGNKITVEVLDNGSPASISGGVTGYVVRDDGATVAITGTLTENRASIVLPSSAYAVVGQVSIVVKVGTTTVGACTAFVYRSTTDTIVDPGHVIPSIEELLAKIADCEAATAAANTATLAATSATAGANSATLAASSATSSANSAASAANTATLAATSATAGANSATLAATSATAAANTATLAATSAASLANTKAGLADEKATLADQKATAANTATLAAQSATANANTATNAANSAAYKIDEMTVVASTVTPSSPATATISETSGHKHIAFGIPKGDPGKDFHIAKTFASIAEMNAYTGTDIEAYDFAMIDTGSVEDADTGKLYCYEPEKTPKWQYIGDLSGKQGIKGDTGNGIDHITLNNDYTLTITYTDGTSDTTSSIRGATGAIPSFSVGSVSTGAAGSSASVTITGTDANPVLNMVIPRGDTGVAEGVPQGGSTGQILKKNSNTDFDTVWSNEQDITGKADKVTGATSGHVAALDSNGNLTDSGYTIAKSVPSDAVFTDTTYSAATQSAAGLMSATDKTKLDGVATGATANVGTVTGVKMNNGSAISPDSNGTVDLGTVITSHQDISGKADKTDINRTILSSATDFDTLTLNNSTAGYRNKYYAGNDLSAHSHIPSGTWTNKRFTLDIKSLGNGYTLQLLHIYNGSSTTAPYMFVRQTYYVSAGNTPFGAWVELTEKVSKSGDTMTGNLSIEVNGQAYASAKNTSTGNYILLNAGASLNHGISSYGYNNGTSFVEDDKWMIYRDSSNIIRVNGRATENVLKAGDTMSGDLTVQKASGNIIVAAKNSTSGLAANLEIGGGGSNHGLYSNGYVDGNGFHSSEKWMIYRDSLDRVIVNGQATDNVKKSGDTMTGTLITSDVYSTNYNLENVGSRVLSLENKMGQFTSSVNELKAAVPTNTDKVTFVRAANTLMSSLFGVNRQGMLQCFDFGAGYIEIIAWDTSSEMYGCDLKRSNNAISGKKKFSYTSL